MLVGGRLPFLYGGGDGLLEFWEDVELLDEKVLSSLLEEIKRSSKKYFM
jgi:hypothetical protein